MKQNLNIPLPRQPKKPQMANGIPIHPTPKHDALTHHFFRVSDAHDNDQKPHANDRNMADFFFPFRKNPSL